MRTILSLLFSLLFVVQVQAQFLGLAPVGGDVGAVSYVANAVDFPGPGGSAVTLTKSGLTGEAASKVGIISFWVNFDGNHGVQQHVYASNLFRVGIKRQTDNTWDFFGFDSSHLRTFWYDTLSSDYNVAKGWIHVLASWDMGVTDDVLIYMNDVSDGQKQEFNLDRLNDYTPSTHVIGKHATSGVQHLTGCLADLYFNFAEHIDLSVEANRRKFISATGKPVDLGSDGSTPTGTAPIIFLNGDNTNFEVNAGSGGNFSISGTLTACSDSPSD